MITLPNILTIGRILVIIPIAAAFFVDGHTARWVAFTLYSLAAITDFFDGWLARRSNQISDLGKFLDPIADKLLVAALIVLLASFQRFSEWSVLPAVVIMLREILVSGLREYLAGTAVSMPVTFLAKWKTTIQLFSLGFLIVGEAGDNFLRVIFGIDLHFPTQIIGEIMIWVAALLTLYTGYDYLARGIAHIAEEDARKYGQGDDASGDGA